MEKTITMPYTEYKAIMEQNKLLDKNQGKIAVIIWAFGDPGSRKRIYLQKDESTLSDDIKELFAKIFGSYEDRAEEISRLKKENNFLKKRSLLKRIFNVRYKEKQ
jgi:formylmethanofuran dehydrogenase subunit E